MFNRIQLALLIVRAALSRVAYRLGADTYRTVGPMGEGGVYACYTHHREEGIVADAYLTLAQGDHVMHCLIAVKLIVFAAMCVIFCSCAEAPAKPLAVKPARYLVRVDYLREVTPTGIYTRSAYRINTRGVVVDSVSETRTLKGVIVFVRCHYGK